MSHDPIDDAFQKRHELNIALSREYIAELESEVAALRAEVEGMREDAERYRWLRDTANYDDIMATLLSRAPHHKIDAAIDAARKGTK